MRHITPWILMITLLLVVPTAFADLVMDESVILVNGVSYTPGSMANISAGDQITLRYTFRNTFTDLTLGHVEVTASTIATGIIGLPHTGGSWVLTAGQSATEQLSFTVPLASTLSTFDIDLNVAYDNFYGPLTDETTVSFNIVRDDIGVEIVDGTSSASSVTCSGTTDLSFSIINTGTTAFTSGFAPEVLIYNQQASTSSFNTATGQFAFSTAPVVSESETLAPLLPGEQRTERFTIDTSQLGAGSHRVYFYIVNPYFDASAFYIGDQDSAPFTIGSCAASFTPTASTMTTVQGEPTLFSVDPADDSSVSWSVTRGTTSIDSASGLTYTFVQSTIGTYTVRATVGLETHTWTINVQAPIPATLSVSTISIANVRAGQAANATVTIINTGTSMDISSLTATLSGVNAMYQARIVGTLPATLATSTSTTLQIELVVPTDEASGAHTIGNLIISGTDEAGVAVTATQPISLNPQSLLTIESVELNGKIAGDLTLEEANEFDVEVKNEYTEDMEDITITVTILNVDGDDVEEESESFDLDEGKDETFTLSFDLSSENVDESQYTVQVEVEGEGTDGTNHRSVQTMTIDVERENHKVIVQKATLGSSTLQCTRQTSFQVVVENIGESDEDDVEIRVKNVQLGIDLSKADIELDKFSGNDNEYRTTFNLNFEDAVSGSHTLTVEVYRDGSIDDTDEVVVQISPCSTSSSTSGQNQVQAGDDDLAAELERQLQARQQQEGQPVQSSFRDGDSYPLFLGILAVLMFIAVVMAIVVLLVKKK